MRKYYMKFKEWVKLQESPSLFGGDIWRQNPGTTRVNPKNWDMNMPTGGGGVAPTSTTSAASLFSGAQQPKRMKKK